MKFFALRIVAGETTRWKPQRADTPIDVVFESAVQLQSATLEVTDSFGDSWPANVGNLVQLATTPLYRYKLPWTGPWSFSGDGQPYRLPAGNYSVVVHGKPVGGSASIPSAPYDRVSLVEVKSVQLFANSAGQSLDFNPTLPRIVGQVPSQARPYGGGVHAGSRIFAEAASPSPSAPVNNTVAVYVETFPLLESLPASAPALSIRIRSLDVDDPAVSTSPAPNQADLDGDGDPLNIQDNRGSPKCGQLPGQSDCLTGIEIPIPLGATSIWTSLTVSGQPGDNYRVAASTNATWLDKLAGYQPSEIGEVRVKDGSYSGVALDLDGERCVSKMLTVWRTLHLERDTTLPIPQGPNDAQRNFIEGKVTAIVPGPTTGVPLLIKLEPDAVSNPIPLHDGSPNLTSGTGNGRFENGTITIGSLLFTQLNGNGTDYVIRSVPFSIPYSFTSQSGGPPGAGSIVRWNGNAQTFGVTPPIPGGPQIGTLTVAGVTWSDVEANGSSVTLSASHPNPPLRFRITDDDQAPLAVPQSTYLTPAVDNNPHANILAQAYIRVQDIPGGAKTGPFVRNVETSAEALEQLNLGRDVTTSWTDNYWAGYLQGSFQGPTYHPLIPTGSGDKDPYNEGNTPMGGTIFTMPSPGSLIFLEARRDGAPPGCSVDFPSYVVAHEVGHQFNLEEAPEVACAQAGAQCGIMWAPQDGACPSQPYFSACDLHKIRQFSLLVPPPIGGACP